MKRFISGLVGRAAVRRRVRRAFTLVELVVAVGAVALLTVGVGRIFQSIGSLVSTGSAIAEVEQLARAIEAQMRKDFEALNRMRADEVFMAIRCRRVGDINYDGTIDNNANVYGYSTDRALYLTPEDREADLKDGLEPYEEGSRAVTRRLDEIMFLAFGGDGGLYHSYTPTCKDNPLPASPCDTCERDVSADTVRIYYGHGLRPAIDVTETSSGVDSQGRLWRSYYPDGDFGAPAGSPNRFDPGGDVNNGAVGGRNEYAGDWPLLRHALLLYGGEAAGASLNASGFPVQSDSVICNDREYAPYIRDAEMMQRMEIHAANAYDNNQRWAISNPNFSGSFGNVFYNPDDAARPRLIQHGRVDICAQSPEEVRRWLEGHPNEPGVDASPFDAGRFNDPTNEQGTDGAFNQAFDYPLWTYRDGSQAPPPGGPVSQGTMLSAVDIGVRGAIAGCFQRLLCETEPPAVNRGDEASPEAACDSIMDTHAVFATRCSNFEVAWSDPQAKWVGNNTPPIAPGNTDPETFERVGNLGPGDRLWFDYDFPRRALEFVGAWGGVPGQPYAPLDNDPGNGRQTDCEILDPWIGAYTGWMSGMPLRGPGRFENGVFTHGSLPWSANSLPNQPSFGGFIGYDWKMTGGAIEEYKAVWPYRVPDIGNPGSATDDDRYVDQAFAKPQFIRVRMTLHDSQMRLKEGKDFEFIFFVDLQ